jgi:elongation factor Ts
MEISIAIENLRKRTKVAANRSDRESTEGAAIAVVNADKTAGVVITLNCETFVGMNESFVKMATEMANQALNFDTKEAFLASDFNGITIADKLINKLGYRRKITNQFFDLEGARVLYPLWKQDCYFSCII